MHSPTGLPRMKMDGYEIAEYESVLGVPERVNIPCLLRDIRLCQNDIKGQMTRPEPDRFNFVYAHTNQLQSCSNNQNSSSPPSLSSC